ncbi:hypothetical protein [Nitrospira sp. Ecomares 2.1]
MKAAHTDVSERRVCRVLDAGRATVRRAPAASARKAMVSGVLATQLQALIAQHPTDGHRRLWALLR